MFRPWWFPEYTPAQQRVWDLMIGLITDVFIHHGYQHIWTPAVESVEVLKKWWDIIDQQVYGLFGLAQWSSDIKEYALHFDLTVPLARYVLDHQQDIVFPFSRYQIQPVRRGESTKRWRYKEFRQCDIDTIWRSERNVWQRYDAQSIIVMESAIKAVCKYFWLSLNHIVKVSHLALTKAFLSSLYLEWDTQKKVITLLDNYFKLTHDAFEKQLSLLVSNDHAYHMILDLITSKNYSLLQDLPWYDQLISLFSYLWDAGVVYEYDICIVRGQNYYSGMVCEWLDKDDIALGSLAAWWRYDNLTTFLDNKQSFSGVGTSLGRFTAVVMERILSLPLDDRYLIVNFDTLSDAIWLMNHRFFQDKIIQLYPMPDKLSKQFEYAQKAGYTYIILYGEQEKNNHTIIIKNIYSWLQETISLDTL